MFLESKSHEFVNLAHVYAVKIHNDDPINVGSFRLYTSNGDVLFEFEKRTDFESMVNRLELLVPTSADWVKVDGHWFRADKIQCIKKFGTGLQVRMTDDVFELYSDDCKEFECCKNQIEQSLVSAYALESSCR